MFEKGLEREIEEVAGRLGALVAGLDPESVPLPAAVDVWEAFCRVERLAATGATLMARRVEESRAWKAAGARSAEEFLSNRSGVGKGRAKQRLDTGKRMKAQPATDEAARAGTLSPEQAAAITDAATANPAAQQDLVDAAAGGASLPELKNRCAQAKASGDLDLEARYRRIHGRRSAREWTDLDGSWHFHATGTVVAGQRFMAALQRHRDNCFQEARRAGRRDSAEALTFDALMRMAEHSNVRAGTRDGAGAGDGPSGSDASAAPKPEQPSTTSKPSTTPIGGDKPDANDERDGTSGGTPRRTPARYLGLIRVDLSALRRGRVVEDELCEIAGFGPVPVSVAKELLGESLLRLVCTRGYDVLNTTALGRAPNAAQLAALLWRSPGCEVRGCAAMARIENDHVEDFAHTRHTRVDECQRLCNHHHDLKTRENWAVTTDGTQRMVPPDHPDHPGFKPGAGQQGEPRAGPATAA